MKKWMIDKNHSTVGFEVKHMMVSKVRGQFDSYSAVIEADDLTDLTSAKIAFKFAGESINTRHEERDNHLKSADFFDIKNYPTIDFKSTNITENRGAYKVTGDLTIKNVTKSVTFVVTFGGKALGPDGVEVYGFEAETMINRGDFGLTWNAALETGGVLVGEKVKIFVQLELNDPSHVSSEKSEVKDKPLNKREHLNKEIDCNKMYQMITEKINDFILVTNKDGTILFANPSLETVLNDDPSTVQVDNFIEKIHPYEQETVRKEISTIIGSVINKSLNTEFQLLHKEGYYMDVEADIITIDDLSFTNLENDLVLIVMREVTERKKAEEAIYHLAFNDHLTNLPNRRSFMNQLQSELMDRKYSHSMLSVLCVDLDNFKQINDQWGHEAGDFVIKEVAERIQSVIGPENVVARFGGDEFVVMLKNVHREDDVKSISEKLVEEIYSPINHLGQEYLINIV